MELICANPANLKGKKKKYIEIYIYLQLISANERSRKKSMSFFYPLSYRVTSTYMPKHSYNVGIIVVVQSH